jgi:hypothetical protein
MLLWIQIHGFHRRPIPSRARPPVWVLRLSGSVELGSPFSDLNMITSVTFIWRYIVNPTMSMLLVVPVSKSSNPNSLKWIFPCSPVSRPFSFIILPSMPIVIELCFIFAVTLVVTFIYVVRIIPCR